MVEVCPICWKDVSLTQHHITPVSFLKNCKFIVVDKDKNKLILCRNCHKIIELFMPKLKKNNTLMWKTEDVILFNIKKPADKLRNYIRNTKGGS